jgi:hypothetical protein
MMRRVEKMVYAKEGYQALDLGYRLGEMLC